jgi:hypothetical protein
MGRLMRPAASRHLDIDQAPEHVSSLEVAPPLMHIKGPTGGQN